MVDEQPISSNEWLTVPQVAERLNIRITKVHRLISEGELVARRRDGILYVPGELVTRDERIAAHIAGIMTVLRDNGFTPEQMLQWLFTVDESLAATPAAALHGHKAREVKRRAQALAW
ncbi:MAG TPA: Rv2175c family DNA-binding protein [Mycobacteriales bacterium]|nr:Rv2175c family DNA-binding protein [Mycobacteriales bacterium]